MRTSIKYTVVILLFFVGYFPFVVSASHSVGGGFTYRYIGDTIVAGSPLKAYEITLDIYQDCLTGVPDAIAQDNPAFITIYNADSIPQFFLVDSIFYDPNPNSGGSASITLDSFKTKCGTISKEYLPAQCLLRKRFTKTYYFPANASGYHIVYQRCCRNSSIVNLIDPGDEGITLFCKIPSATINNSCAKFKGNPPQIACLNIPMQYNMGATDADGDSLSYEFCTAYKGADGLDIKPRIADPPPYAPVVYFPPYSPDIPMPGSSQIVIDQKTGTISVTPDQIGRYLINVQCNEWRNGVLVNSNRVESQLVVRDCGVLAKTYKPDAGIDQTVLMGQSLNFEAKGGTRYLWLPGDFLNNPYISNPVATFTKPGTFTYVVTSANDSGCTGSDTITVHVLEHATYTAPNAFTPNGDGHNDVLKLIAQGNVTLKEFRVYNRWGNMIFHSTNLSDGWDGTAKGKQQDPGVYVWSAEYDDNTGTPRVTSGNVTLLR